MTSEFAIWCIAGLLVICLGIFACFSKKAVGFWANADMYEVTDIKKYNRATGMLFCVFGAAFILLGLPLRAGQDSAMILISILGVMFEVIAAMVIYTVIIEKKFKKK